MVKQNGKVTANNTIKTTNFDVGIMPINQAAKITTKTKSVSVRKKG